MIRVPCVRRSFPQMSGDATIRANARAEQALEFICAKTECSPAEASDLLRENALALDQDLEYTALDMLDEVIRLDEALACMPVVQYTKVRCV